jgi:hypothetical protein
MKKLYYTVGKQLNQYGDVEETNGYKTITVYDVINNEIVKCFIFEVLNEENTVGSIELYLDDNGYGDEIFELILL